MERWKCWNAVKNQDSTIPPFQYSKVHFRLTETDSFSIASGQFKEKGFAHDY